MSRPFIYGTGAALALVTSLGSCSASHDRDRCELPADERAAECFGPPCGWQQIDLPPSPSLPPGAVWGSSDSDVWSIGWEADIAWHRDAAGWSDVPLGPRGLGAIPRAIWGRAADDVWVVGDRSLALHYDGSDWGTVETGFFADFSAVGGTDDGQVWIGTNLSPGHERPLRHFDGTVWSPVDVGASLIEANHTSITDIWAGTPDDVWVTSNLDTDFGRLAQAIHWDGRAWSAAPYAGPGTDRGAHGTATSVWASGPSDVWVGGSDDTSGSRVDHFDGRRWGRFELPRAVQEPAPISDVWGTSPNDVWVGDEHGMVFHFDGAQWENVPWVTSYAGPVRGWSSDACHVFMSDVFLVEGTP